MAKENKVISQEGEDSQEEAGIKNIDKMTFEEFFASEGFLDEMQRLFELSLKKLNIDKD